MRNIQFRGVQPNFRNPMVHKWNLMVQRELPGTWLSNSATRAITRPTR